MTQRGKTIPPQACTRIFGALDRLIEVSTATNKPDDVKKWQAERARCPNPVPPPGEKKMTSSSASARGPDHPT